MRIPRDVSGRDLIRALARCGYTPTRQTGSHVRVTTTTNGEHHVTVPLHAPLRVGTLGEILKDVAAHLGITRDELIHQLFDA